MPEYGGVAKDTSEVEKDATYRQTHTTGNNSVKCFALASVISKNIFSRPNPKTNLEDRSSIFERIII